MIAAAEYLCQVSGMQEADAPLSCNWFYLRCEIGSRKKTHQKKKKKKACWSTGRGCSSGWPRWEGDVPVALLEPYANPLLNFIFLMPLIRSGGIKPAGKKPMLRCN